MSSGDKAAFEPDLSLPAGALDQDVWNRILNDAFSMTETEIDDSLVPDFDESSDTEMVENDFDEFVLGDDILTDTEFEFDTTEMGSLDDDLFDHYTEAGEMNFEEIDPGTDTSFDFE
ncbi:MAG: hypothetical protein Q4A92_00785 [Corynebacterium sp.]|nr:hypothetical protein [Corynebacterium sp.]